MCAAGVTPCHSSGEEAVPQPASPSFYCGPGGRDLWQRC